MHMLTVHVDFTNKAREYVKMTPFKTGLNIDVSCSLLSYYYLIIVVNLILYGICLRETLKRLKLVFYEEEVTYVFNCNAVLRPLV